MLVRQDVPTDSGNVGTLGTRITGACSLYYTLDCTVGDFEAFHQLLLLTPVFIHAVMECTETRDGSQFVDIHGRLVVNTKSCRRICTDTKTREASLLQVFTCLLPLKPAKQYLLQVNLDNTSVLIMRATNAMTLREID